MNHSRLRIEWFLFFEMFFTILSRLLRLAESSFFDHFKSVFLFSACDFDSCAPLTGRFIRI